MPEELANRNVTVKVCEHKTKDCARLWTFQHKCCDLCLFVPLKFVSFYNHFLILTIAQSKTTVGNVSYDLLIQPDKFDSLIYIKAARKAQRQHSLLEFVR